MQRLVFVFETSMPLFLSTIEMQAVNSQFELQLLTFSTTFGIEPSSGTSSQAFNIIVINSTEIDFEKYDNMKLEVRIYDILIFSNGFKNFCLCKTIHSLRTQQFLV